MTAKTQIKKLKLDNGVRVLLDEIPSLYSATVSLWVDSSQEIRDSESYGMAHFMEHMLFKSTQKQAPFKANAQKIQEIEEIEDSGGSINALTDKETTCFYAQVLSEEVNTALKILAKMAQTPQFSEDDVALERQVICHEIQSGSNANDTRILETWIQNIWGNHPLAQPVIGTEKSIQNINLDKLIAYHQSSYTPENLIISIAGRFNESDIIQEIQERFGALSNSKEANSLEKTIAPLYKPCQIHLQPDSNQALLCLGGQGITASSPHRFTLGVLDVILGGGMNSRLFKELRQEKGLVYSIHPFELLYRHTGLFGLFAQSSPENLNTVCQVILNTFDELMNTGPTEEELNRAKRKISGNLLLNMESTRYRASRNARTEIYQGQQNSMESVKEIIHAISTKEVQALCQELMTAENLSYAYTGSAKLTLTKRPKANAPLN